MKFDTWNTSSWCSLRLLSTVILGHELWCNHRFKVTLTELLDDLATVANNRVVAPLADAKPFDLITRPTTLQRKAFKLLGVRLERTQ